MQTLPGTQLTDQWMVDPTMFDPTQRSNQFSQFNNAALPWPPTYGNARGPVNAATGQPIQSYQDWLKANPTPAAPAQTPGTTLNQTQPQLMDQASFMRLRDQAQRQAAVNPSTGAAADPNAFAQAQYYRQMAQSMAPQEVSGPSGSGMGYSQVGMTHPATTMMWQNPMGQPQAAPQAPQAPNNWNAAIQALANPGNPVTQGATVPQVSGYQPAGGVNQAFLNNMTGPQGGPGAAPMGGGAANFLSALRAVQGRPQQGF